MTAHPLREGRSLKVKWQRTDHRDRTWLVEVRKIMKYCNVFNRNGMEMEMKIEMT